MAPVFVVIERTTMFGVWFDIRVVGPFYDEESAKSWLAKEGYIELASGEWDREPEGGHIDESDYQAFIEAVAPPRPAAGWPGR